MTSAPLARMAIAALLLVAPATGFAAHKAKGKAASKAPGVADIVEKWGLVGSWAVDCTKPATIENGYQRYMRRGSEAVIERDFGERRDSNKVISATAPPSGALELQVEFAELSQTRAMSFIKGPDDRIRALSNRDIKGGYTVIEGKFVGGGGATPWQSRCP